MGYASRPIIILKYLIGLVTLGIVASFPIRSEAITSNWAKTDQTQVRLISGSTSIGDNKSFWLGLQFQMNSGWKVYWRSPGDAGFPPEVKWDGSQNLESAKIHWPVPLRFSIQGLQTLGYKNEVVLPILATVMTNSKTTYLNARVRYLTCNNICIPYEADLSLELSAEKSKPSEYANLIEKFRAKVPGLGPKHDLKIEALNSIKDANGAYLQVIASAKERLSKPDVFIEGTSGLTFGKPKVRIIDEHRRALMILAVDGLNSFNDKQSQVLENRAFKVTLVDGIRATEQLLVAQPGTSMTSSKTEPPLENKTPFVSILLFAILGGLILNLMPCVLPVLSIKVLGLIQHGGGDTKEIRASFLASAAGIVSTFLVLASALSSLKAGGMIVGWGIQFQQPWFLISLTLLITIFACNLWGFFEFRLPQFISVASINAKHTKDFYSHFLQGALATLLATPCSAPFVGTAVGFALIGSTIDVFLIFGALGFGLAIPYLIFATFPIAASRLPKAGPWMIKLKFALGCTLAATGFWLLTVLFSTSGPDVVWICAGLIATIGLVLHKAHKKGSFGLKLSLPVIFSAFFIALVAPEWITPSKMSKKTLDHSPWQTFDEMAIPRILMQGKIIFVDVTADWCITCFANKSVVLNNKKITQLISSGKVIAMRADWTKPDVKISRYLARYNRYGIPFNIVYGPNKPEGVVLPELLTPGIVLNAFSLVTKKKHFNVNK